MDHHAQLRLCSSVEPFLASDGTLYLLPSADKPQLRVDAPYGGPLLGVLQRLGPDASFGQALMGAPHELRDGLRAAMSSLLADKLVYATPSRWVPGGPHDRQERYFDQCGMAPDEAQARLSASRVLVLGLGGVGGHVAEALARAGVGVIGCLDHDFVAPENLPRQTLYRPCDVGRAKTEAAAARLREIAPACTIESLDMLLDRANLAALVTTWRPDAIAACADTPAGQIEHWIDESAHRVGAAYVLAGQRPPRIHVGPMVVPGSSACLACIQGQPSGTELELAGARARSPFVIPALGPGDMVAAAVMAWNLIDWLGGVENPSLLGRSACIDMRTLEVEHTSVPAGPAGCARCCATAAA